MSLAEVIAGPPVDATGGVQFLPLATTESGIVLPTDATTPIAGGTPAGYIGEDGLTETIGRETEKVKAWGGYTVKVLQTDFDVTYTFTLLEALGATALQAVHGKQNVSGTTAGGDLKVMVNQQTLPHQSMVFDMKDGDARLRIVLPDAQITEVGETTYSHNAVVGYEVTIEAFADGLGNNAYKYASNVGSSTDPTGAVTATAGSPGSIAPAPPADISSGGLTMLADPASAWTSGQYVVLGDGTEVYWDGEAWATGQAPAALQASSRRK